MTALGNSCSEMQVFPVDYEAVVSQRLVDASHANDLESALECIADPFVNVNFIGTVCLKARRTELVLADEAATQVRIEFEEFRTEVAALFLAAHAGNVTLVLKLLVLKEGRIIQAGKYDELLQAGTDFKALVSAHHEAIESMDIPNHSSEDSDGSNPRDASIVFGKRCDSINNIVSLVKDVQEGVSTQDPKAIKEKKKAKRSRKKQLVQEEERERGRVNTKVYLSYMVAAYKGLLIPLIILAQTLFQVLQIASNWWMAWANPQTPGDKPRASTMVLLVVYMALAFGSSCFIFVRAVLVATLGLAAAQKFFLKMLLSVFRTPMSFFDSTPAGRILNRVSVDQSVVDLDIPFRLSGFASTTIQLLGIVGVMTQVTWQILLLVVPMAIACLWMQKYYMASSRELVRIVSIQKSPIIHLFGESISGAATIRGFGQEKRFMKRNLYLLDCFARPFFCSLAAIEWLCLRMELLSTFVFAFCMVLLVSFPRGSIDPSMAGLAVTYGLNLNSRLSRWILSFCKLENKIISVERIDQYCQIPSEAPPIIDESRPPVSWPENGAIELIDLKCGVDPNANARVLLRSSKTSLHTNVDCNALVAAIVSRQISVVKLLLQAGVAMDIKARLGAWSWDMDTGEEFHVGAGLAEPYSVTWCAVEYFESTGSILRMLLHHVSPNIPHLGRTIIHQAIFCNNARAVDVLLDCHSDMEFPVQTTGEKIEFRPIHLASRLGSDKILQQLIDGGCNLDSKTESGETALMICARYKQEDCLKLLASGGADFGLVNSSDHSVESISGFSKWNLGFQRAVLDIIHSGKLPYSSNPLVFSPLLFVARSNDIKALTKLVEKSETKIDEQDGDGFSAVMIAAAAGNVEAFRLLVFAGADVKLHNKYNETAITLSEAKRNVDVFEKVILDYSREKGSHESTGFYPMHRGASRGDMESVGLLMTKGYDVNVINGDGFTPLMLAARGGHGSICELLISGGAKCDTANSRLEIALKLTRKNGVGNDAEGVILDEIARKLVLGGGLVKKHTKEGKGCPHRKVLKMVGGTGLLRWGKSRDRNVICKEAEVGPSLAFRWNRRRRNAYEPGLFRVVTAVKNKEVHFVCDGGSEMAELWVRGIQLVTREAIFGKKQEE